MRSLRHIIADIEHLLIEEVNIQCHIECCVSIIRGMAKVKPLMLGCRNLY